MLDLAVLDCISRDTPYIDRCSIGKEGVSVQTLDRK